MSAWRGHVAAVMRLRFLFLSTQGKPLSPPATHALYVLVFLTTSHTPHRLSGALGEDETMESENHHLVDGALSHEGRVEVVLLEADDQAAENLLQRLREGARLEHGILGAAHLIHTKRMQRQQ